MDKTRAYAGLAYAGFEALMQNKHAAATQLIGDLTKRLLADAGVSLSECTLSQLQRLMEESLEYLLSMSSDKSDGH